MTILKEAADRTLTIRRIFDAPIELVWEAWTKPDHIANWWGPEGMQTSIDKHDFQVGGHWRYSMRMPDGNLFIGEGEYLEIEEQSKIVFTADFKPMTEGVEIHVLLKAKESKTEFTFHVVHRSPEYCQQQEQMGFYNGWGSTFDRLTKYLSETEQQDA